MCKPRAAALGQSDSSNREPCMGDTRSLKRTGIVHLFCLITVLSGESVKRIERYRPVRAAVVAGVPVPRAAPPTADARPGLCAYRPARWGSGKRNGEWDRHPPALFESSYGATGPASGDRHLLTGTWPLASGKLLCDRVIPQPIDSLVESCPNETSSFPRGQTD